MPISISRHGSVALVTGASSGIGEAFCRTLAARGFSLIAVARREERLQALKGELEAQYGVRVVPVALDITSNDAADRVAAVVESEGLSVDVLVNNAGFGLLGTVESPERERAVGMVDLNCRAVIEFTYRFLPAMKARQRGAVIVVSSVVGSIPVPWFAIYGATKAFDLYFGEALYGECHGTGVDVLTVLPGLTKTEFQGGAGLREYHSPYRTAQQVVDTALKALGRKPIVVDGIFNKMLVHGTRFVPRGILTAVSRFVMKKELHGVAR
jgi:short-subunit dehydrogenase